MLDLGKAANVEIARLVHAEDTAFRIRSRRNKQLGLWAASKLGMTDDALDYAKTIVGFGLTEPDDEGLIRHIHADLSHRGVRIPQAAVRCELERQATLAVRECTLLQPSRKAAGCAHDAEVRRDDDGNHPSASASSAAIRRMPARAVSIRSLSPSAG